MIVTACIFFTTILTLYGICRFINEQNELFKEQFVLHIIWLVFYLIVTLITIYTSNLLVNEVCLKWKKYSTLNHSNWSACVIGKTNGTHHARYNELLLWSRCSINGNSHIELSPSFVLNEIKWQSKTSAFVMFSYSRNQNCFFIIID